MQKSDCIFINGNLVEIWIKHYLTNIGRTGPLASTHAHHYFVDRVKQSQEDEDEHADYEIHAEHATLSHIS